MNSRPQGLAGRPVRARPIDIGEADAVRHVEGSAHPSGGQVGSKGYSSLRFFNFGQLLYEIGSHYIYTCTVRGHYQIDVQCIKRHVTAGLCFEYLGSYESSEHALSNEVW